MLKVIPSEDFRVYVVWLPIMQKDLEERAAEAAVRVTDKRATHYWNPDNALPRDAARAMRVQEQLDLAWDVFLLYGPDSTWSMAEKFPVPSAWMHRLNEQDPRWMTTVKLRTAIQALLPTRAAKPTPAPAQAPKSVPARPTAKSGTAAPATGSVPAAKPAGSVTP